MEFDKCLRDGTNIGVYIGHSKNVFNSTQNFDSKNIKHDKANLKQSNIITKTDIKYANKENEIMDISMLSIKSNDIKLVYTLPDSLELLNEKNHKQWISDMKSRRWQNRMSVCTEIENLERRLKDISFDYLTGERYLLETLDYRMDLEVSKLPLGRNFLQKASIDPDMRASIIDLLFSTSAALGMDRYVVPMAIACADRYAKIKGVIMRTNDYKNIVLSCWFLCCKFELIYYPPIEELCTISNISDPKIILNIETDILKTLEFYVTMPTPIEFLRPLSLLKQRDGVSHNIAKFFLEVSLYVYDLTAHPAHIIAAASYCLSMALSYRIKTIDDAWTNIMKIFTGLDINDIRPVIAILGLAVIKTDFKTSMMAVGRDHETVIKVLSKRHADISELVAL